MYPAHFDGIHTISLAAGILDKSVSVPLVKKNSLCLENIRELSTGYSLLTLLVAKHTGRQSVLQGFLPVRIDK